MNFILQAFKGKTSWWIWIVISLIILYQPLSGVVSFLTNYNPDFEPTPFRGDSNPIVKNFFLMYVGYLVLLLVLVKFLHKRPIKTIITSRDEIDWLRFFVGLTSWGLVAMLYFSINFFSNQEYYIWNYDADKFFNLLLIGIFILPFQSSFTEIFYRGYLLQGFSLLFKKPWLGLLASTLIFTLVNCVNPEVITLGFSVVLFYIMSAIMKGVITILDDGAELAMGINTINNFIAMTYITSSWSILQTNALWLDTSPPNAFFMVYLPVFVFFPLYIFVLFKIFKWKNGKEKLFGTVENPF